MSSNIKRLRSVFALWAGASTLALAVAAAPASATELYLQTDGIYDYGPVTINGSLVNLDAYAGPLVFEANSGIGPSHSITQLIGFCVDIFHNIDAGLSTQQALNLQYHTSTLTTDGDGDTLSALQVEQVGGLVDYGVNLYLTDTSDPELADKLAGVQGAIWQILNPTYTITGGTTDIANDIAYDVAHAPLKSGPVLTMYADNFATQGFAIAGGVPEPASWAMMIVGMLAIGGALRHARVRKPEAIPAD